MYLVAATRSAGLNQTAMGGAAGVRHLQHQPRAGGTAVTMLAIWLVSDYFSAVLSGLKSSKSAAHGECFKALECLL